MGSVNYANNVRNISTRFNKFIQYSRPMANGYIELSEIFKKIYDSRDNDKKKSFVKFLMGQISKEELISLMLSLKIDDELKIICETQKNSWFYGESNKSYIRNDLKNTFFDFFMSERYFFSAIENVEKTADKFDYIYEEFFNSETVNKPQSIERLKLVNDIDIRVNSIKHDYVGNDYAIKLMYMPTINDNDRFKKFYSALHIYKNKNVYKDVEVVLCAAKILFLYSKNKEDKLKTAEYILSSMNLTSLKEEDCEFKAIEYIFDNSIDNNKKFVAAEYIFSNSTDKNKQFMAAKYIKERIDNSKTEEERLELVKMLRENDCNKYKKFLIDICLLKDLVFNDNKKIFQNLDLVNILNQIDPITVEYIEKRFNNLKAKAEKLEFIENLVSILCENGFDNYMKFLDRNLPELLVNNNEIIKKFDWVNILKQIDPIKLSDIRDAEEYMVESVQPKLVDFLTNNNIKAINILKQIYNAVNDKDDEFNYDLTQYLYDNGSDANIIICSHILSAVGDLIQQETLITAEYKFRNLIDNNNKFIAAEYIFSNSIDKNKQFIAAKYIKERIDNSKTKEEKLELVRILRKKNCNKYNKFLIDICLLKDLVFNNKKIFKKFDLNSILNEINPIPPNSERISEGDTIKSFRLQLSEFLTSSNDIKAVNTLKQIYNSVNNENNEFYYDLIQHLYNDSSDVNVNIFTHILSAVGFLIIHQKIQ